MTDADSLISKGANAYSKPAAALSILRETVVGDESFDFALRQYGQDWAFKRPYPADFFRRIEDASGKDLDWFWRGWFYSTEHVDMAISDVTIFTKESGDPKRDKAHRKKLRDEEPVTKVQQRLKTTPKRVDRYPELKDFYNDYDHLDVTKADLDSYEQILEDWEEDELALLDDKMFYNRISIENLTGLPMPVILKLTFDDDSTEEVHIPAHIWRRNQRSVSKLFIRTRPLIKVELDPRLETADVDVTNNHFPRKIEEARFKINKSTTPKNPMQEAQEPEDEPED